MRRVAPFALVSSALVFTGCILFGIDDLSGGNGAANDDASNGDAITGDASFVGDGGAIETDSGNEGGRFCPQFGAFLCSDYDDTDVDASVPGSWDSIYAPGTAQVAATTAEFQSAPRSLIATTTGSALAATISKNVLTKHVELSFDIDIASRGGNASMASFTVSGAGALAFKPTDDTQSAILESDTTADGGTDYNATTGPAIMTGTWIHVDCVIDLPMQTATLSINGAQTILRRLKGTAAWTNANTIKIAIGFGDSNNATMYYDNVTIRTQ